MKEEKKGGKKKKKKEKKEGGGGGKEGNGARLPRAAAYCLTPRVGEDPESNFIEVGG